MITLSGYKVTEQIHEGNISKVYRGTRESDGAPVVIKVPLSDYPPPKEITRIKHEYEILKRFDSSGVIKVYGMEPCGKGMAIIMEFFPGQTMSDFLKNKKLSPKEFLKIAAEVARILGEIHKHGIIHKDINPLNILINAPREEIKIIDFGISSGLSHETQQVGSARLLEGTLKYISPEQTGRMNRLIDYRTDFYSLGVTFYEMLTGNVPFKTTDSMELIHQHIAKLPAPPHVLDPQIPQSISNILMKLLAKTSEERYKSAFGLMADFNECLKQLDDTGTISLVPGQHDVSDKFEIPQKLYGRQEQINLLMSAFDRVYQGRAEVMLVAGYSGIGKSALIHEIHKPITQHQGYFISGKFDLLTRSNPYQAIIKAFQELTRQILTESEDKIEAWRKQLLAALSINGQVVINVIPEVELIIGKQPPVPSLSPTESQTRFNFVFRDFVGVFAKKEHPLVIFLDDLQWADMASLDLIEILMTDQSIRNLFFIGAYRDNEVDAAHPLLFTLKKIKDAQTPVNTITLPPLEESHLRELVTDTLNCQPGEAKELTGLVLKKTGGNPFFVNEFLKTLYQEHLITFNGQDQRWDWDLKKIEEQKITDNVVDLISNRIQKLSPQTQEVLKLAACLGNRFDLATLAMANGKSMSRTSMELWEAIHEELIIPIGESATYLQGHTIETDNPQGFESLKITCKFLHDRVQQAAYELLNEDEKKKIHLRIGRLLLEVARKNSLQDENIFDIVEQLNAGKELINAPDEKAELSRLNLLAGKKAKASKALQPSLKYLIIGMESLQTNCWESQYDLTLDLHMERAECEYLSSHFDEAERFFDLILQKAKTKLEKVQVYNIKVVLYLSLGKAEEAVQVGREGLRLLGVKLPSRDYTLHILWDAFKAKLNIGKRTIEDLALAPDITDKDVTAKLKLLMNLTPAAYHIDAKLVMVISLKMTNLSLRYGNSDVTAYGYLLFGVLLNDAFGRAQEGYRFGRMALKLNERYDNREIKTRMNMVFATFLSSWVKHIDEAIEYLQLAYKGGMECGDLNYIGYSLTFLVSRMMIRGDHLDHLEETCQKTCDFFIKTKQLKAVNYIVPPLRLAANMRGRTKTRASFEDEEFSQEKYLKDTGDPDYLVNVYNYEITRMQAFLYYKFFEEAYQIALPLEKEVERVLYAGLGRWDYYFYYVLTLLGVMNKVNPQERKKVKQKIRKCFPKLKKAVKSNPSNFLDRYLLLQAEMARGKGHFAKAAKFYQDAIQAAEDNRFMHNQALACELAGDFYLQAGFEECALGYLTKARFLYEKWGATEKVKAINEEYHELFSALESTLRLSRTSTIQTDKTQTEDDVSTRLDLNTIMQVSTTISGETVLGTLLEKIMKIAIQNAGAERGFLILDRSGQLLIEAEGTMDQKDIKVLQSIPVDNLPEQLCKAVLQYVKRTMESVVLDNAVKDSVFSQDPYIQKQQAKSLLCTPIVFQGKLFGMLYLENNLSVGAFTPERLNVLNLLSSQAAMTIGQADAMIDGLTRLWVRKHFMERAEQELKKATEREQPCALLMMDLDHFKQKNDTYGHQMGDYVLRETADRLKKTLRDWDCLGRYGGEEFILLLPNTSLIPAQNIAKRLLEIVSKTPVQKDGHSFTQTVSMGVAIFPDDAKTLEDLIHQADQALYKAKQGGRNQVCR